MRGRISAVLMVLAMVLLLLLCSGALTPTVTALGAGVWTVATWAWVWIAAGAVLVGPLILLWAVLKGPPRRGEGWVTLGLVGLGLALTLGVLRFWPLLMVLVALVTLPFCGS